MCYVSQKSLTREGRFRVNAGKRSSILDLVVQMQIAPQFLLPYLPEYNGVIELETGS